MFLKMFFRVSVFLVLNAGIFFKAEVIFKGRSGF